MADGISIEIESLAASGASLKPGGDLVLFVGEDLALSPRAAEIAGPGAAELVARAAGVERFKGKASSAMVLTAPAGLSAERLVVIGTGSDEAAARDWASLGGYTAGKLGSRSATLVLEWPGTAPGTDEVAAFSTGARLRAYKFDRYKSKKSPDGEETGGNGRLTLLVPENAGLKKAMRGAEGLAEGVILARELVNEPPNVLDPEEFARRASALEKLGVEIEILDEKDMKKLGMRALLAVAQGSAKEARSSSCAGTAARTPPRRRWPSSARA